MLAGAGVLALGAPAAIAAPAPSTAVVALLPADSSSAAALQALPGASIGLLSTAQGTYTPARMLGDLERAARRANASGEPRLRIVKLPAGEAGQARLDALARDRPPGELLLALEQAGSPSAHELRWAALAGLGEGRAATLSSRTTRERGLIAAVDVAPTLFAHLGLPIPASPRGKPIKPDGALNIARLQALKARLEVVYPRRLPGLACLLGAWMLLLALAWLPLPFATRSARVRWGLRVGALALLWTPVTALLPAAIEPSAAGEYGLIVATGLMLATLTDALLPWPRAPIAPALAAVATLSFDALAGTQLSMRSLLGPNPAYGSRFYGIGNELKSGLAVLVFAAVAAGLYRGTRSRRSAVVMAACGALLAIVEGSALIGAGVGGVVLVNAGTAAATVLLLPGSFHRGRLLAILAAPVVGLALLAALDLATAKGAGHFTGSVLDARSFADVRALVAERYRAAWHELGNGLMPLATGLALAVVAFAVRWRERLHTPVGGDPGWQAALAGGTTAGVVGALVEDSGPVLLVVAVFTLACVAAYLWGSPHADASGQSARWRERILDSDQADQLTVV